MSSPSFTPPRVDNASVGQPSSPAAAASARFDAALTAAGFGRYQLAMSVVPCAMLASNSMLVLLLSLLRTKAAASLGGSPAEVASAETLIPLVTLLGMLVGAPCFGWLSDHHGRRVATIVCGACVCAGLLVVAASPSLRVLYAGVVLCGVASGGLPVGQTLLAEFVPYTHRGLIIAVYASFWTTGILLMSLWYAAVAGTALGSWRNLALFAAIPNALAALGAYVWLRESPRYLLSVGRHACADKVLTDMAHANGNAAATAAVFAEHVTECEYGATSSRAAEAATNAAMDRNAAAAPPQATPTPRLAGSERLSMLLAMPSLRGVTLRLWAIWWSATIAYFAVVLVAPDVGLEQPAHGSRHGKDNSNTGSERDEASARWLVLQAAAEYPSYGLQFVIGHWLDRRTGMSLCTVLAGAAGLLWATAPGPGAANVCAFILFRVVLLTLYNLLWLVTPESYPTALRSTGSGACAAVSGIAGAMAPLALLMSGPALCAGAVGTFIACVGSAWTLPTETAGKHLADGFGDDSCTSDDARDGG